MTSDIRTLGKYQILDELGRGGFATVYRALDPTLDREVALKVLHPQLLTDPAFVARFRQEARALANLRHPQIVTVYEVGEADGRLFIAMELAHGPSLAQAIAERGRIPWDEALALLKLVCEALDYAHGQEVVHRDLKPANILLDRERGPLLTDFGFARLLRDSSVSLSLSGGILGTPAYIAPEVWEMDAAAPAADIYGLGCIVFEVLTGEVLFGGQTPMQVMRAHDRGPQFPDAWPPDVPAGVAGVLRKGLAREPGSRYPSAQSIWYALSDLNAHEQAAREAAERAAVAAQWRAEAKRAMAAGEWSTARMAARRWQALTPDDRATTTFLAQLEEVVAPLPRPQTPVPRPQEVGSVSASEKPRQGVPGWAWVLGGFVVLVLMVGLVALLSSNGAQSVLAPTYTPAPLPTVAVAQATSIPQPTATWTSRPTFTPRPVSTPLPTASYTPRASSILTATATRTTRPTNTLTPTIKPETVESLLRNSEWTMDAHDPARTAWNAAENVLYPPLKVAWTKTLDNYYPDGLSIGGGRLYVSGMGGQEGAPNVVYALTTNGQIEWSFTLTGGGRGSMGVPPACHDGKVFFGGQGDDKFYALYNDTGKLAWELPGVEGVYASPPASVGDLVYAFGDKKLYALSAATGDVVWSQDAAGWAGRVVVYDSAVVALAWNTAPTAFHALTGKRLWQREDIHTYFSDAVAYDNMVYLGSDLRVLALDLSNGQTKWSAPLPGGFTRTDVDEYDLALANGILYVAGGVRATDQHPEPQKLLLALDSATGKIIWQSEVGSLWADPVVANGVVYTVHAAKLDFSPQLLAFDARTGALLWQLPNSVGYGNLTVADGRLYLTSLDAGIHRILALEGDR